MSGKNMDDKYDKAKETQKISIRNGFIEAIKYFKYLGSYIGYHTKDDYDINRRITEGNKLMEFLIFFLELCTRGSIQQVLDMHGSTNELAPMGMQSLDTRIRTFG